ncbi:MAG: ABC transporter substrate-binding protein [Xanthobacteraceae bacterium]|nr:MAG: ABC transporter substrate-binding protein [Xanthobacteraceae bacterium]
MVGAYDSASAQQVVKIGLLMAYTGQFTEPATQMDNGIKLYMKEHGNIVAGKKIEVIRKDTAGAPDTAKRMAQELIVKNDVNILAGFVITPEALTVADLSANARKLMVVMNAATSIITTMSPYITRSSMTLPQNTSQLGLWAARKGIKRVFTLVSDYAPGHDAENTFQEAFKSAGGQIVGSTHMPLTNPDFSPFVQRAKDSNPDGIFIFVPGGSQPPALAKALIERGIDPKTTTIMGQGEIADESSLRALGEQAEGMVTAFHYDYAHSSAKNVAFVTAYNKAFQRNPDFYAVGGYDGMHLIYEALKKTNGNTNAEGLIAAIKGMKWESPRGMAAIDPETRDIINTVYIREVHKVDGKMLNVEIEKTEGVIDPVKARMRVPAGSGNGGRLPCGRPCGRRRRTRHRRTLEPVQFPMITHPLPSQEQRG